MLIAAGGGGEGGGRRRLQWERGGKMYWTMAEQITAHRRRAAELLWRVEMMSGGESDGTEGRRQRGTKCNTGGPRDVRPELWTQMTASSTAAVEADERQNEAECLGAASGQKYCSAHNNKKSFETFSRVEDPCGGSDTTSVWRASSPKWETNIHFLPRWITWWCLDMQTVLVSRVEAVKDFALDTDILKDAQFDTDYCFVSIPFLHTRKVWCVWSLYTSNQRVSPSYTSRQRCDPFTLLRIPTGVLRVTRLHVTVKYFTKQKLSLVFWGVSGAGLPPFNSAVNTFSLCAA